MPAQSPQVVDLMYRLMLYLIPQTSKFPKNQRYLLGERIEQEGLDVLLALVVAQYQRDKQADLVRANLGLQKMRFLIRLCRDLDLLSNHKYEFVTKQIHEVGIQVGGWAKSTKSR
ncbi:MAG: diversity-generating retroelement protein Avd [Deltaproteobacteria bacterium]|nr:diversity-generating retroelement protein Avd [Deltaproteobacteria bacterium]